MSKNKEERSAVVGGAGFVSDFMIKLTSAIRENGGTDGDLHIVVRPEGKLILDEIAKIIVGQNKQPKFSPAWRVKEYIITPTKATNMKQLVADWKNAGSKSDNNYINSNITDANFPTNKDNLSSTNCKIFIVNFGKSMTAEQAIVEVEKYGLKPPTIQQGILFATQNPDIQREKWIVVPHKPWQDSDGNLDVLYLRGFSDHRLLRLGWYSNGWNDDYWFLFVGD